jgi:uncharacterized membrane protein YjgN (DUF898 family)
VPLAHRARDYYIINNRRFGGKAFHAEIPGTKIYGIYGMALLFILGGILLAVLAIGATVAAIGLKTAGAPQLGVATGISLVIYVAAFLFTSIYVGTRTFNLALNNTHLNETLGFESTLSPWRMIWIGFSNLVLVLISLGLLYPWARIRSIRYMADHLAVSGTVNLDDFTGAMAGSQGAIGEEVASFFDIDIGL